MSLPFVGAAADEHGHQQCHNHHHQQHQHSAPPPAARLRGCCSAHELLLWRCQQPLVLLLLRLEHHQGQAPDGGSSSRSSSSSSSSVVRLTATATAWQPSPAAGHEVVCACSCSQRAAMLALCTQGARLQLHAAGGAGQLAEFRHPALAGLQPQGCRLAPGPLLVLQPEPATPLLLLLLQQAGDNSWQLLEVVLPPERLLQQAQQQEAGPALLAPGLAAAGPWRVLHASLDSARDGRVQLLLAQPVSSTHGHLAQHSLLVWLELDAACAEGSALEPGDGVAVAWCHSLSWQEGASCAAVATSSSSSRAQQLVAVGSAAGAVQVLQVAPSTRSRSTLCALHAAAELPGAVHELAHLPAVVCAGSLQTDVLAVLHDSSTPTSWSRRHASSSSMAVTLLGCQAGRLERIAVIPGALALVAPSASAVGLVVPAHQQQQQQASCGGTVQLAAVVVLDAEAAPGGAEPPSIPGLDSCAWLGGGAPDGVPGPLLGLLAAQPPWLPEHTGEGPEHQRGTAAADEEGSSELQGLQAMLAVLEARWQMETRDLGALKHRLAVSRHAASAAHNQLCQLAADGLQGSTVRQYAPPLSKADPHAALAVYQAGKQQQQQQQQQTASIVPALQPVRPQPTGLNLSLQLEGTSSGWQAGMQQFEVAVRVRPALHAGQNPTTTAASSHAERCNGAGTPCLSWRAALLQPCHAELLLWHASTSAVTAASSWTWDPLSGELLVTGSIARSTLLRVAQQQQQWPGHSSGSATAVQPEPGSAAGTDYVSAAQAMAAAASAAAGGGGSAMGSGRQPSELLQLHAVVVAAACCSSQAVVQWSQQQCGGAAGSNVQQADLTSPASVLLHLPPIMLDVCELLRGVAGLDSSPAAPHNQQHQAFAPDTAAAPAASAALTPPRGSPRPLSARPLSAAHVIPPTPNSAVIPDSEEEEEQEPRAEASLSGQDAAAAGGGVDPVAVGGAAQVQQQQPHAKQLLLLSPSSAGLQQQAAVALQQVGGLVVAADAQPQRMVLQAGRGDGSSSTIELVAAGDGAVLVELKAHSSSGADALHQLLLAAVQRLQTASVGEVRLQASPLDAAVRARLAAATDMLADAVSEHVAVLEQTLRQMQAAPQGSGAQQQQTATAKRGRRAGPEGVCCVDGADVGRDLSAGWLALLKAQADVDLAMSQLQAC